MPFLLSILKPREPGMPPPLLRTPALGVAPSYKFWLEPWLVRPTFIVAGFEEKPSKNGCFKALAAVILFCGSKVNILFIRSMACSEALGIS